ncbi:MAG: TetR/AcrR family transcriptional regulator [Acetatifactor sp.]
MGEKGKNTRERIKNEARILFSDRGYKDVSMQDICNVTGLSKGGLYRHFRDKAEILLSLVSDEKQITVLEDIAAGKTATEILERLLHGHYRNMLNEKDSLAYALYEYAESEDSCILESVSECDRRIWEELVKYGIERGEFNEISAEIVMNTFLYAYRGVRMWSRVLVMNSDIYSTIIEAVKVLLIKNYGRSGVCRN